MKLRLSRQGGWWIEDTGFPKKGRHSVGVTRQYCGMPGKQDNCQVAAIVAPLQYCDRCVNQALNMSGGLASCPPMNGTLCGVGLATCDAEKSLQSPAERAARMHRNVFLFPVTLDTVRKKQHQKKAFRYWSAADDARNTKEGGSA